MKCLRCHNEKESLFAYDQGVYYCRRCVAFGRMDVGQTLAIPDLSCRAVDVSPELKFALTKEQEHVSEQALAHLKNGKNVFVYAATGAGKTEICYRSICHYLKKGKKVGFAISRRQVVLEIAARLREVFPTLKIVEVCQDYTKEIDGDLIVCTIHQLYRYPETFDLLILDELDAFPYAGNALLKQFVDNACKGERLCLSATLDPSLQEDIDQKKVEVVALFQRPHKKPLIVPEVIRIFRLAQRLLVWHYCLQFTKQGKQTIVFVPRKKDTLFFELLLHPFNAKAIHSSKKTRMRSWNSSETDSSLSLFRPLCSNEALRSLEYRPLYTMVIIPYLPRRRLFRSLAGWAENLMIRMEGGFVCVRERTNRSHPA